MSETTKPDKEKMSPEREALEIKLKEVQIDRETHDLQATKLIDDLEIEQKTLQNEELRKGRDSIEFLLSAIRASCIDNERTTAMTTDPVYKSVWEEHELNELKSLLMKKVRKL